MRALALLLIFLFVAVTPAAAQTSAPVVEDAWVMTPVPGATEAAAYLSVRNAVGDRLLSIACECAARADLHDMRVVNGIMEMRPLRYGVAPDAAGVITLSPNGAHVMLVGLAHRLRTGDHVRLRLTFRGAGVVEVEAEVHPPGRHSHH